MTIVENPPTTPTDRTPTPPPSPTGGGPGRKRPEGRRSPFDKWFRRNGWRHLVMLLGVVFALFPAVWTIAMAFNPEAGITTQDLWPENRGLGNFRDLFNGEEGPFGRWMWNTVLIGMVAAGGNAFMSACAAYAFSRQRFKGRRTGLLTILLVQMFPQVLAMVAIFVMLQNLGDVFPAMGLGTRLGLLLVYLGGALGVNTWLMKGFFDTIPRSLDESAKIDGASHFQIFYLVVLPLAAPIIAVVTLLGFIVAVNEFVLAGIILRNENDFTLAVGLSGLVDDPQSAEWGVFAAGSLIASIPVIVLWLFLQRYVVSGLTAGAVKE